MTHNLRLTFGYSLLYWSKVARPGDQIDPNLHLVQAGGNPAFPPLADVGAGAVHPRFQMRTTDLWAQGMNFGLSYRF